MNSKQEWQEGPPTLKRVGPTTCGYCLASFPSTDALRAHKLKKIEDENNDPTGDALHLWCEICDLDFHTLGGVSEHMRLMHRHKQDFPCPGCAVKFNTLSAFIKHVELGHCCKLDIETLQARFASKLTFAKGLAKLDQASKVELPIIKQKDFSLNLGYDADPEAPWQESINLVSGWEAADQNTWASSEPAPSKDEAFPRMAHHEYLRGSSKAPDLLTGGQTNPLDGKHGENDWARQKNLFPDSHPAQRPTTEQLQGLSFSHQAAVERARGQEAPSFDPNSPYFDPQQCWHEILQKYKCPHKAVCKKTFNKKAMLVQHLRSAAHNGKKFSCPSCKDSFETLFSLAAHVESPSRKCKINREFVEQDMYRIFLDQLTLGMVEVGGIFDDHTQEFKFQEEFKDLYGPQKNSDPTFGHMQMHGSSRAGNPAPIGLLTEAALSKHQQQLGKGGAPPPGQQRDNGRGGSGRQMALTSDALSKLQLQEKRASPWGQRSQSNPQQQAQQQAQQQRRPDARGQTPALREPHVGYVGQQLGAMGWDTWDRRPVPRQQDQGRLANAEPQTKGGSISDSEW